MLCEFWLLFWSSVSRSPVMLSDVSPGLLWLDLESSSELSFLLLIVVLGCGCADDEEDCPGLYMLLLLSCCLFSIGSLLDVVEDCMCSSSIWIVWSSGTDGNVELLLLSFSVDFAVVLLVVGFFVIGFVALLCCFIVDRLFGLSLSSGLSGLSCG